MALINCYRFEKQKDNTWLRADRVYKIRRGGVATPQPLGFASFRLQRLLIAIGTEFARLQAQFRGHADATTLNAAIRSVVLESGLAPANAPNGLAMGTDDLGAARYSMTLFIIDKQTKDDQALAVAVAADGTHNPMCISCGELKAQEKWDPQVKSHSVIPASFWEAIVPSALAAIGVNKAAFAGEDAVLVNSMVNAGSDATGTYAKPGADAQAISMCTGCEGRQADFSLLQRHEKAQRWLSHGDNSGKEGIVRTFVGTQFLPQTGIGPRDEMIRVTYNVARRVAGAIERQLFMALDRHISRLPAPDKPAPTAVPKGKSVSVSSSKFVNPSDQIAAMKNQVLPQLKQKVPERSINAWLGVTSLEARQWSADMSSKRRHWADHLFLRAGLQMSWITHGLDHGTPLKARLLAIGKAHAARRAKTSWNGQGPPAEPPLVVYIAQNIDAFLQALVEIAVLFAGLTRQDATKDEKEGVVKT